MQGFEQTSTRGFRIQRARCALLSPEPSRIASSRNVSSHLPSRNGRQMTFWAVTAGCVAFHSVTWARGPRMASTSNFCNLLSRIAAKSVQ